MTRKSNQQQQPKCGCENFDPAGRKPPSVYHERLRHFYRRPDQHPFVIDIPGSIFHGSRAMPTACTRYPVVVGQSFWRLAAYLDSVPPFLVRQAHWKDAVAPAPHLIITGIPGCGKSYLMAASSALLGGFKHHRPKESAAAKDQRRTTTSRTVFIGDCLKWIQSDDPLQYFRMELMSAFRDEIPDDAQDESVLTIDHRNPEHPGCMVCVEPFARLEQLQRYLERIANWITTYQPSSQLIFFLDQAEALGEHPDSLPTRIVAILIHLRLPVLVFSVAQSALKRWPFRMGCTEFPIPFRFNSSEYGKQLELLSKKDKKMLHLFSDLSHVQELRAWTGCVPGEVSRFLQGLDEGGGGGGFAGCPATYRKDVDARIGKVLAGMRLDQHPRHRNTLLIGLFAMILRVPLDWTERKFQIGELRELLLHFNSNGLEAYLLPDALQTFYHPSEGSITLRSIPTAVSHAAYLSLSHPRILEAVAGRPWEGLFEKVVQTMLQSKQVCTESKRRFSRFYAHARLRWMTGDDHHQRQASPINFPGKTELGEDISLRLFEQGVELVYFSTLVPSLAVLTASLEVCLRERKQRKIVHIFLPSSPRYWFFDLFILQVEERRLWAVTTAPLVGTWLKDLSTRAGPMQLAQQREDGVATPLILLDSWREVLKRSWTGSGKIGVRCLVVQPTDLMEALAPKTVDDDASDLEELATRLTEQRIN